jgi:hypothetical protein
MRPPVDDDLEDEQAEDENKIINEVSAFRLKGN